MSTLKVSEGAPKDDVLVLGLVSTNDKGGLAIESGDLAIDTKSLLISLGDMGATGAADEITKLPGNSVRLIVFTGLGKKSKTYSHETLRRAAGAASRSLSGTDSATVALPTSDIASLSAVAEGAALGAYVFSEFRGSTKSDQKAAIKTITFYSKFATSAEAKTVLSRAKIIADYTFLVRDLINTPPSHLTPDSFTKKIASAVRSAGGLKAGLKISVLDEKQLKSQGFGGIIGVGQGSANPPRLLHISYTPKSTVNKRFAFIGKGITFDTGGLALKPALGMEAMKSDMSGAAAVCAATIAIAALKLPVAIETWAPLAENMPSDKATRPSDIITIFGGKTIEVLNPDAEGRLVLADAIVKAQAGKNKLDGIIDVATLTGAQVVALGTRTSAVMTNNDDFSAEFLVATARSGEQFWPMPLPVELRASLDSPVADMANIGDRNGGMLVAGLFLKEFVNPDLPWLHLDIAGPAFNVAKAHGYTPVGGTGIALRSLVALVEGV
ncbi:MAG: leucyl aminopeptidase [Actinobacteria bacterium]|uniref:leucyl aminopeptidase n=1 Tax=freshwater metagenome TaxID=449393 RepID=A0A6J7DXA6_9ZZZZ|nr:leucyl aminopeptidase [Actinomycetota bacterium]